MKKFLLAAALVLVATPAFAQTTVVLGSGSTFTNPGVANLNDPACASFFNTWCARNVRNSGEVGITTDFARSGNGSLQFSGPDVVSYKSDFEYYFSANNQFTLNSLESFGYDWFRAVASQAPNHLAPALRLILSDFSYLVYEPSLNGPTKNLTFDQPTDSWQTNNFGDDGYVWWSKEGTQLAYSLAEWKAGRTTSNGTLDGTKKVIGLSVGIGSGWFGSFNGAVDNVTYRTTGMNEARTFNFEVEAVSTVPEPSTYALMAAGLAALGMAARRRRRNGSLSV